MEINPNIVELQVIDYGVRGEYGFFGKIVAKSTVRDYSPSQIENEKNELRGLFGVDTTTTYGANISIVEVEEVPAATDRHGNKVAQEGCDRCFCGCKYWENDKCIDCGTGIAEVRAVNERLEQ